MKIRDHPKIYWPPNGACLKSGSASPTPSPQDHANDVLREVCPLIPGEMSLDLRVASPGQPELRLLLSLDVKDMGIRQPLARLLEKHKGKTIAELGELCADF